jgi:hypothetical protein
MSYLWSALEAFVIAATVATISTLATGLFHL